MKVLPILKIFSCFLLIVPLVKAQNLVQTINWCEEATQSLTDRRGNTIDCRDISRLRCVRINNYWCQKHTPGNPWRGTTKENGQNGNQDEDGHAIFDSVPWSARAITIDLRTKYRRGFRTALDIATVYSPWCDTLGSKAVVNGYGRTCDDGRAKPPSNFAGPFCKKPERRSIQKSDCLNGCNCPPRIAEVLIQGSDVDDINSDLNLFDESGPGPDLKTVIRNLARQEQGIFVRENVIEEGISLLR